MDNAHNDDLPVIYADIEKIQRELQLLCSSMKAGPDEKIEGDAAPPPSKVAKETQRQD